MPGFVMDSALVREYRQQLETILPAEIDGIESEGDMVVQYVYIRDSLEYRGLVSIVEEDMPAPIISKWKYVVRSMLAPQSDMEETLFLPSSRIVGTVYIPIEDNELVLDDVDFLEGLRFCTVSYI